MGKKIIVAITILLIAGLFTGWYFFTQESKYLGSSAFSAVPENSAVVIRIHNLKKYTASARINPIWKGCSTLPGIADLYQKISFTDALLDSISKPDNSLGNKELTIAFNRENDHFEWLAILELASLSEKRLITGTVTKYFTQQGAISETTKSGNGIITGYSWRTKGGSQHFYTTLFRGLMLGSPERKYVEAGINQLEDPAKPGNAVFGKVNKNNAGNVDARIYVNHKRLPQFAKSLFSETFLERYKASAPFATWSELDLTQKQDEVILNGISFTTDSLNNHLQIFLRQQPDTFRLARIFPAQSTFFLSYEINNNVHFFEDYEQLLANHHHLEAYRKALSQTDSLYGINLQKIVSDHLDGSAAIVYTQPDPTMAEENKYLVLRINSESQVEEALSPLAIEIPGRRKRDKPKNYTPFVIDAETEFKIYQTEVSDFGSLVFGELFAGVKTNFYATYDNYLVMGSSFAAVGSFLKANVLHETLENNQVYRKLTKGLSDKLNIYLWCSPGRALPFFREMLNNDRYAGFSAELKALLKIESVGWQIGNENGMLYNMARLQYNPEVYETPSSVIWKSHPGSALISPPIFIPNSSGKSHSGILIQDKDLNLMLINADGRTLWKIKLTSPINNKIIVPKGLSNGKQQFFFSTSDALYSVNQDGKILNNNTFKLKSTASNAVSVFDYDKNNDYRFFIACKDHKVYLYDKKGKIVTGWNPPKTEHLVTQPVQFFRVENKDYLVFTDKNRAYILDRKGKPAVTVKGNLTFSNNAFTLQPKSGKNKARLITTDATGTIISVGFDGSIKKIEVGTFSPEHHFLCLETTHDTDLCYLFLDNEILTGYDRLGNSRFTRKFKHSIPTAPQLFRFPNKSIKLGITDTVENKIYLLNSDGAVSEGFPLDGSTPFDITYPDTTSGSFGVVTATPDGELINYEIK